MRPVLAVTTSITALAFALTTVVAAPARAGTEPNPIGDTSLPPGITLAVPPASARVSAAALPVPTPPDAAGLPADIETAAAYVKQTSCDPNAKPGAVALGDLLRRTYPGSSYSVGRDCGADGMASEHYEGRAVDWFVSVRDPAGKARAEAFLEWLTAPAADGEPFANARRLGVMYLIWNNRIWGSYNPTWRPYGGCAITSGAAQDTSCHRDHIHISLSWAGAMKRTSYWTGSVAGPDYGPCIPDDLNWAPPYAGRRSAVCPTHATRTAPAGASPALRGVIRYSGAQVQTGSNGVVVRALQSGLAALGITISIDGGFGPQTAESVKVFQRSVGRTPSGVVDGGLWRALIAALTKPIATTPGSPKPPPAPTPSPAPTPPSSPSLSDYRSTLLRVGATGPAVTALQRALGITADGHFGPMTKAAVIAFQRSKGLTPDGVVGSATWIALGA